MIGSLPRHTAALAVALLALLALHATSQPVYGYEKRFDCGGSAPYVDFQGHTFVPDPEYTAQNGAGRVGGYEQPTPAWMPIGGTPDETLYKTTRNWNNQTGPGGFKFDVPPGNYIVCLKFADIVGHGPGLRIFDIAIEGQTVLDDFDIYDEVEGHYAIDYRFKVLVNDGQLNITMTLVRQLIQVNAIEVYDVTPDATAPGGPTNLWVQGSYGRIMLDWADNLENDLEGYFVERGTSAQGPFQRLSTLPIRRSRAEDATAALGVTYYYRIVARDVWLNESSPTAPFPGQRLTNSSTPLPIYEISITQPNWDFINANPDTDTYVTGSFTYNGTTWTNVGLRYRGRTSRSVSKKSWKIKFNEFVPGQQFLDGQEEVNLDSQFGERTMLREKLSWDLTEMADVLSKESEHVQLRVNGDYYGVYTTLEQIDERWLADHGLNPAGNLYKAELNACLEVLPDSISYTQAYIKVTNRTQGYDDLIDFIELVDATPPADLYRVLAPIFDIEGFINNHADMMALSTDSFYCHNYYLYHDLTTNKWTWIPHDLDSTFGHVNIFATDVVLDHSLVWGEQNDLIEKLHDVPHFRRRYLERTLEIMSEDLTPATFDPLIDSSFELMREDALVDWRKWGWEDPAWIEGAADEVKGYIPGRQSYVQGTAPSLMPQQNIFINEILANNDNTLQDEAGDFDDLFEIYNAGPGAVNLAGHFLTDNITARTKWAIPDTVLAAGAFVIFWADSEMVEGPTHTNFHLNLDGEWLGIFGPIATGNQPVDTKGFGPQIRDVSYGRFTDGSYNWTLMGTPTPGVSNLGQGNLPPSINHTTHFPISVPVNQSVRITAEVADDGGVAGVSVFYDANAPFVELPMNDNGNGGDLAAGDGVFTALIPGQPTPREVLYYVEARDALGRTMTDPVDAPGVAYVYYVGFVAPPLFINEFMALNVATIADEFGQFDDWVEIYNGSQSPIALGGYTLTDNLAIPDKFTFPDTTLAPHDFLLVWCDNDPEQGPLHADFRLNQTGEELALLANPGLGFALVDTVTFHIQRPDTSQGRFPNGGSVWRFYPPGQVTPGEPNSVVGVEAPDLAPPRRLVLSPSRPNPTPGITRIAFGLPVRGRANLVIYDAAGRAVARLLDQVLDAGFHEAEWDGRTAHGPAAAGIYFYRLRHNGDARAGKITLLR